MSQEPGEATSTDKWLETEISVSPAPSNVSVKSDWSKDDPPSFSQGQPGWLGPERSVSPTPDNVSVKSDWSKDDPPSFSKGQPGWLGPERSVSPAPDNVSVKSDWSKDDPPSFSKGQPGWLGPERSVSPTPDNVSVKSDWSKDDPPSFSKGQPGGKKTGLDGQNLSKGQDVKHKLTADLKRRILSQHEDKLKSNETDTEIYEIPSVPSENAKPQTFDALFPNSKEKKVRTVLMRGVAGVGKTFQKSLFLVDWAKGKSNKKIDFIVSFNFRELNSRRDEVQSVNDLIHHSFNDDKDSFYKYDKCKVLFVLDGLEKCKLPLDFAKNKDLTDMEERASMDVLLTNLIKGKLLPSACLWIIARPSGVDKIPPDYIQKETECRETSKRWQKLASALRERFLGEATQNGYINHPNQGKTEHIIREEGSGEVNDEEKNGRSAAKSVTQVTAVSDIFKDTKGQKIRTVLTTGEAGIGKSFHVQQFIKEWAKKSRLTRLKDGAKAMISGKADEVIFPLNFSELNLIKEKKVSLMELLNHFLEEPNTFVISNFEKFNVLFVLDGLDAYQPPLDFDNNDTLTDVSVPASVDVLLTSLIRQTLLPSARLWITSRLPELPDAYVDRTTEIRWKDVKHKLAANLKKRILSQHEDELKSHETDTEIYEIPSVPSENAKPQTFDALFPNSEEKKVRTVLMRGVAGVGKTFQKSLFLVDWAKGKSNKKIDLMVSFNFRELNSGRDKVQSMKDLIHHSLNDDKDSFYKYDKCKVVFVLDGLEKCKLPLDFAKNKDLTDMEEPASMDVLLTNLIKGKLLPSACLWIISRPSGVAKIPPEYIHKETECRETSKRWQKLASALKERFLGEATQDEDKNHPNKKNTEHIIREEGSGEVNDEEKNGHTAVKSLTRVTAVSEIFKDTKGQKIRTVLTTGGAGSGKSFHVQQFIKEWAKKKSLFTRLKDGAQAMIFGKADEVIFPLNFSELNLIKEKVSLLGLLNHFFKETETFVISNFEQFNVSFVLDGLDAYQPPLDFDNNDTLTDVSEPASVDVLLTSIIRGTLLPSARLWITSRLKLPDARVDRTTEIRYVKQKLTADLKRRILSQHEDKLKSHETDTEIYEIPSVPSKNATPQTFDALFPNSKEKKVRTVLMRGVAGVGKTFQKSLFLEDWAKGKSNTKIDLMVPFNFCELNSRRDEVQSVNDLIHHSFNDDKDSSYKYDECKVVFVLDGLEECELPLDFAKNEDLTDMEERASMDVLLTNLIKGKLLPSACLWIIARPSGVDKIPPEYIHKETECRETSKRWQKLASALKERFLGEATQDEDINHLNKKNTEHIMIEDRSSEVNDEEKNGRSAAKSVTRVNAVSDIFKDTKGQKIRTVLTTGVAGIGKSFHVQQFIKEWAKKKSLSTRLKDGAMAMIFGKADEVIFHFNFSKLNLIKEKKVSLMELLNHFFKETKTFVISNFEQFNVSFVLDGLDAYQPPLDFDNNNTLTDVREPASVDLILTSLIRGTLLPSARLWITSRLKLSDAYVDRTTEIRCKPDIASHQTLKSQLKEQFTHVHEGIDMQKASALLNEIYTDLYIIEGERGEVNDRHEIRQVQDAKFKPMGQETSIKYCDIFKPASENIPIRTVLTIGMAGIGKTFATKKYMLDWAEGSDNRDIYYMFPLSFRELNLRKEKEHSLEELIHQFCPGMKTSEITDYDKYRILIVLDGLDECRLDLDFNESDKWTEVRKRTSVNVLLRNLIQGNLLSKAQIWITSRPAASNHIPADKVDRVTEVRGFNDEQKEEYFRKRFGDTDLAEKILSHVKKSISLYIMCHIPVFCWITAKVLENFVNRNEKGRMPETLTDMYIHFLVLQCRQANVKYGADETGENSETDSCWNTRNKETVMSLGKLAFEGLVEGNLLFTEETLKECGVDITETAVFSGLFTQIKREGSGLYQQKLFCFVHLSIQEFLAAFYVFHTFNNTGKNLLAIPVPTVGELPAPTVGELPAPTVGELPAPTVRDLPADFYKTAIDKALKSKNGDWDLFLRFLLGLSLETNQKELQELLKKTEDNKETINKETIVYIKEKIREENSDADRNCNLFYCLNELKDNSLVEEVKDYLKSETLSFESFSTSMWSALTFVLLTSYEKLGVFDLKKYLKSEKVLLGMLPVVKVSKTALLSWCELSEDSCRGLSSSVLCSVSSNLTELDLSHNDLLDAGVKMLAEGLQSLHCKLEILKLSGCQVTEEGCSFLASALTSKTASSLKKLDLSYNHPGPEGETMLSAIAADPNTNLKTLCLDHCGAHRLKPGLKKYGADLRLDENTAGKRLALSDGNRKVKTVEKVEEKVLRPENIDRFKRSQVFCEEGLKGLCYWEVELKGTVGIAVAYRAVGRRWDRSGGLGCNKNSWSLLCSRTGYTAIHENTYIYIDIELDNGKTPKVKPNDGKTSEVKLNDGKTSEVKTNNGKTSEVKPNDGKTSEVKTNNGKTSEVKPNDGKTSEVKPKDGKTSEVKPNDGKTSEVKTNNGKTSEVKPNDGKTSKVKPKDGKTSEVKPNDGKTLEVKPKDGKTSEVKPKDGKTSEVKPKDGKTSEVKPKDGKTSEVKTKDGKTSEVKTNDGKTSEVKPNDGKTSEVKPNDGKTSEVKTNNGKTSKVKPNDGKTSEVKPKDGKTSEVKPKDRKTSEVKPNDGKTSEVKTKDGKTSEVKPNDGKTSEVKTNDGKTSEVKPNDGKTSEVKPKDGKTSEVKPNDGKTSEVKPKDGKTSEVKPKDGKTSEAKPKDGKTSEVKTKDGKTSEVKTNDGKTSEVKPNDGKTSEVKPKDGKTSKVKPNDGKTSEVKPKDGKTSEVKPKDGKTSEVKPKDGKTSEVKPKDGKTSEVKTKDGKTSEVKPNDGKTSEVKTNDGKTSEVKPNDGKTSEVKPKDGKTSEVKPKGRKTSEVKPNNGKTSEVKPKDGKTSEVKPKDGKTSEVKTKDGKTSEVKPNDGKTSEVKTNDGKTSEVKPNDGKTSEVKPNDGKTSEVKPKDGKTSEVKPKGRKTSEVKPNNGKTSKVKPKDGKTSEVKPKGRKTSQDLKLNDGKTLKDIKPNKRVPLCKKIAVFLDWEAGTLTYYGVISEKLIHIHTFHAKFTEPLFPCFWFRKGSVTLCEID
ncbi:uncharacterized protein LOC141773072 isoform X3 [Sebastes fasciatus]|uniref:uncharacterized protein LOC141773072 isoform X3 n=1 Tax=Sebastes fasciatus TaxID=394691 RepID=UPI003D9E06C9